MRTRTFASLLCLLTVSGPVAATTLQDVLNAAWEADNEWQAARYSREAADYVEDQGRGGLLPQITAQYSHIRNETEYEPSSNATATNPNFPDIEFESQNTSIGLVQPLFRVDSWYEWQRTRAITSAAEAYFQAERQNFLLRVAEQYMLVLRTREELTSAEAEERAIGRQLEQTRERYNVGLVPITDVHEAQAAYDLARVGLIVAQANFHIARDELEALTGRTWESLAGLQSELPLAGPQPEDPEEWVARARERNPLVLAALYESRSAQALSKQALGLQLPQVNLVGGWEHSHNLNEDIGAVGGGGGGGTGAVIASRFRDTKSKYVGVQVNVPLFAGGALNARRKQAALEGQAAQERYRQAHRDVGQQALSLHRLVLADVARVKARHQALVSAESALRATEAGYQVGTRNVVDVLNAQRTLYAAQRDWFAARYDYILDSLRLKATAGTLSERDLEEVDNWLSRDNMIALYPGQNDDTSDSTR